MRKRRRRGKRKDSKGSRRRKTRKDRRGKRRRWIVKLSI
jgi:hypothetical protein